ncbi:ankyrin repeat-containing domain protein [Microdochium bolleyi]|uniref:Ankyrin repeat-containing domain protein n=1 Tax=Microdochium bolleyi TaxID=196109 RepID=A0A136IYN7_9PEZI|nr:ankyrin repeat-containing domain protein [Microdochium bolleyi]
MSTTPTQEMLMAAAAAGDLAKFQSLCQSSRQEISPVSAQELLSAASQASQLPVVEHILDHFPNLKIDDATVRAAAGAGSAPLFSKVLAKDGSAANRSFERFGTALTAACHRRQPIEFLRYLLEHGADPNLEPDSVAYPVALAAALYPNHQATVDLMLEHGARLEHSGALGLAARRGNEASLCYLLSKGAKPDTDARTIAGDHPLHEALFGGHTGAAEILLKNGSSMDVLNRNGKSIAEMTTLLQAKGEDRTEFTALLARFGGAQSR